MRRDISPYLFKFSPNVGKKSARKTPYLDTFHTVFVAADMISIENHDIYQQLAIALITGS